MDYYIKLGDLEFYTLPSAPSLAKVIAWYNIWKTHPARDDYSVYVVGSFAEKFFGIYPGNPYDVDIAIVGPVVDEVALKSLLEFGISTGFQQDIMIDIWHNDVLINLNTRTAFTQIRSYSVFEGKVTDGDAEYPTYLPFWDGFGIQLASGLWKAEYPLSMASRSWDKANQRILEGTYQGIQKNILTL